MRAQSSAPKNASLGRTLGGSLRRPTVRLAHQPCESSAGHYPRSSGQPHAGRKLPDLSGRRATPSPDHPGGRCEATAPTSGQGLTVTPTARARCRMNAQRMGRLSIRTSWPSDDPERFLSRPQRMCLGGISLLGLVVLMALVVPAEPLRLDQSWSDAMQDIRTPLLTNLALVFNALGRGLGWALSLTAVGVLLYARRRVFALLVFAVTEAVTSLSSTLLKILVARARPPDGLVHPIGSSFPSGHAAYAGATCIALVLLFTAPGPHRRFWWDSRRWESSGWRGVAHTFRCTGSPTSSEDRCSG